MSHNYFVTAHPPTAVTACATGNFTGPDDLNLIVAKLNHIEIFLITPDGLKTIKQFTIYGKVDIIRFFRPPGLDKDRMFIVTARLHAMILEASYNGTELEIITKVYGNVGDRIGKKSDTGIMAVIDPESRAIGLRIYDSLFKVIPLDKDVSELKAYNIRIEEMQIYDIDFLHGCAQPTIVMIHQDVNGRHIKTHELSLRDREFVKVPWKQDNVEREANRVIAVPQPYCGCIIIGAESIVYHNGQNYLAIAPAKMQASTINCYTRIDSDGSRYLLGDLAGHLFMLLLLKEDNMNGTFVKDLKLELLGETTVAECMTYLDNGFVYIGSRLGDSQLIRLNVTPDENQSYITVIETFTNLGPISDMILVDLDRQGQGQLVTCSGCFKEGSLRVIRNGIGINELATVDLPGIKGMWPIRVGRQIDDQTETHNTLVMSFVEQTRILTLNGEEVEETEIDGFLSDQQTFYTGNVIHDQLVQVTPISVRLVCVESKRVLDEWIPACGRGISVTGCNQSQVVCAIGPSLYYLEVEQSKLVLKGEITLDFEIACIDVSPLNETDIKSDMFCVGLWTDISVRIFKLPSMEEIQREALGGEIIPRSILMAQFDEAGYLLCAMGDGSLFYFMLNCNGVLTEKKKVSLGTQPTILKKFKTHSTMNVFACSDRPTVIYSSTQKLVFSNVNVREVKHMCPLNSIAYQGSLALASDAAISIGTIDEIQKLHIRTIPLGETPRRIAYQEQTQTFGVLTFRIDYQGKDGLQPVRPSASTLAQTFSACRSTGQMGSRSVGQGPPVNLQDYGQELEVYSFLIVDQNTFEVLHCHQLMQQEFGMSLISTKLGDDPNTYYILGTAHVNPDESEPKAGRLIIFQWKDGKLIQASEKEIKGSCFSMTSFNGKIVTTINSTVRVWEWTPERELRLECSHFNNIIALYAKQRGDYILVGDLLRSMTLLHYKAMEASIEELARDYSPNWMTAIEIIDEDTFVGAENSNNIIICQRDSTAASEEERTQMSEVSQIHLGDMINVFKHGTLAMSNLGDSSTPHTGSILYGTVTGAIGMLTQLRPDFFEFLFQLQTRLSSVIKSIGKIQHDDWRSFYNERKLEPMEGFIDGDLIETFLNLNREKMAEVAGNLTIKDANGVGQPATVEELMKIVEDLTRIH